MKKVLAVALSLCMLLSCLAALAESPAGVYTFHEQINPFMAIDWTVTLNKDATYQISFTKPTGVTYTYTGNWEVKPDGAVVTGTPNESTADMCSPALWWAVPSPMMKWLPPLASLYIGR